MTTASRYCERDLRFGGQCILDADHRGRCSSVGFYCDNCGKMRRGQPHVSATQFMPDGYHERIADFCFLCSRGLM